MTHIKQKTHQLLADGFFISKEFGIVVYENSKETKETKE
jgi:hypothetical protein